METTFGVPESLENSLGSQGVLPALHNQSEPTVNALMSPLLK